MCVWSFSFSLTHMHVMYACVQELGACVPTMINSLFSECSTTVLVPRPYSQQIKFLFGLPRALAAIPSGPFVTPKVSTMNTVGYSIAILSLAQPDPYAGGEGLVTCCTRSCPAGMQ